MDIPNKKILNKDLSNKVKYSGVYFIRLLFREKCKMPKIADVHEKLKRKFGGVDLVTESGLISFALTEHLITYNEGQKIPTQLVLSECNPLEKPIGDDLVRSQFWNCKDGSLLLDSCSWEVLIGDFMAAGLHTLERANIMSDWLEIALELFPDCTAVFFISSGKLLTADDARNNPYSGPLRLIHGGVNARFFKIEGSIDMVVDTLGLYALGLPDVQYHFHDLDPNDIVHHAYNIAIYQFENDAPIESGHTVEGIKQGDCWKCQYEEALIQPVRDVLDIATGEFASGTRE